MTRGPVAVAPVDASAREFALLAFLDAASRPGALPSSRSSNGVWGYTFDTRSNLVDVYIGYLRRKLAGGEGNPIETVRGWATGWWPSEPHETAPDPYHGSR